MLSALKNILFSEKISCPRCLGKGVVDWEDIKRLKRELYWEPGKCAYCNGKGKVSVKLLDKLKVEEAFVTSDKSKEIIKKFINKDEKVLKYADEINEYHKNLIREIEFLHFDYQMSVEKIIEFYSIRSKNIEKENIKNYIVKIINSKR